MTKQQSSTQGRLRVTHVVEKYLPYSQTWLHAQIACPPDVEASVVAFTTVDDGPAHFPVPRLTALSRTAPLRYLLYRGADHAGLRPLGPALARALAEGSPDVVHAHFGTTAWRCLPVVDAMDLPLVVSFYGYDMSELPASRPRWRRRYPELFARGDLFLCEGPAMADGLVRIGCPAAKIGVNPLGVDVARLPFTRRTLARGGTLQVLAVARFKEKKGLPDAIEAVVRASRRARVHLTIVGGPAAGRHGRHETARIKNTVRRLRAGGCVTFAGVLRHEELNARAKDFHIMLQPSKRAASGDTEGGAPVALIEMAATGMAAVATRHADIPGVVIDGSSGFLADEGDVAALADHLVRLAEEPELVAAMGEAAARHVRRAFDQEACSRRLRRHYAAALEGVGASP